MSKRWLSICLSIALSGCAAGVTVTKIDSTTPAANRTGIPYNLAFTQYEIKLTRPIAQCGRDPKILTKAEIKVGRALDPSRMYLLKSDGNFETSDIKGEYDSNGVTTSLNATSEDVTPAVIGNVLGGIAKIVSLASPLSIKGERDPEGCWPRPAQAFGRLDTERKAVEENTRDLARKTADVTLILGRKTSSDKDRKDLMKALTAQAEAQDKLTEAQKKLADDIEKSSYIVTVRWPGDGNTVSAVCDTAFGQNCAMPKYPCPETKDDKCPHPLNALVKQTDQSEKSLSLYFHLAAIGEPNRTVPAPATDPANALNPSGLPVRFAAPGRVRVCIEKLCEQGGNEIARSDDPVLQLGWEYIVPVPAGALHSGTASLTTGETGVPKSIQVQRKAAAAAVASGIFKDLVTQAGTIKDTLDSAETERLKAKTEALKAQKEYDDAKLALGADAAELKQLQNQKALLEARAELKKAQDAADKANAAVTP